jgi:hypothetical protein
MNTIVRIGLCGFLCTGLWLASGASGRAAQGFGHPGFNHMNGHGGIHDQFRGHDRNRDNIGGLGFFGGVYGYDDGYCGYGAFGNDGYNDHIPYFALHPPVYYSFPVARTYGYSPFANPPSVMTPPVEDGGSKDIINPYVPKTWPHTAPPGEPLSVPPGKPAKPTSARTVDAQEPVSPAADVSSDKVLVIINPYVHQQVAAR